MCTCIQVASGFNYYRDFTVNNGTQIMYNDVSCPLILFSSKIVGYLIQPSSYACTIEDKHASHYDDKQSR